MFHSTCLLIVQAQISWLAMQSVVKLVHLASHSGHRCITSMIFFRPLTKQTESSDRQFIFDLMQ
jgi:hypothetical protein